MAAKYITIYNSKTGDPCKALIAQVPLMLRAGFQKEKPNAETHTETQKKTEEIAQQVRREKPASIPRVKEDVQEKKKFTVK